MRTTYPHRPTLAAGLIGGVLCMLASTAAPAATTISGKYLFAFHACNMTSSTVCNSPSNHVTYIAQSDDGTTFTALPGYVSASGSVPDVIRRNNKIYTFTPSSMRVYNIDTGTWGASTRYTLKTSAGVEEYFVDPSPTLDDNGKIVLFYLVGNNSGNDPATCLSTEITCVKTIRSATEVEGSDGTQFLVDSGNRASVTVDSASNYKSMSDPDIFKGPDGYVLYLSRGTGVQALTATTLKGSYTNVSSLSDGMLVASGGGVPAGYYDSTTGKYWTYITQNASGGSQSIARATHSKLTSALSSGDFTTILTGATYSGLGSSYLVASPGIVDNYVGTHDCLFNWLEDTYPAYIAPSRQSSSFSSPYHYRYYPTTQSYAGVSATDGHVYYLSDSTGMLDVGLAATFISKAGCK